jgi:hypothetical protein
LDIHKVVQDLYLESSGWKALSRWSDFSRVVALCFQQGANEGAGQAIDQLIDTKVAVSCGPALSIKRLANTICDHRRVVVDGKGNAALELCSPVMSNRNPPLNGSAAIQASYDTVTCLPPGDGGHTRWVSAMPKDPL